MSQSRGLKKILFILQIKLFLVIIITGTIQLVGFDKFDGFTVNKVRDSAQSIVTKYSKMFGENTLLEFKIAVDKVREREKHTDFEIKARLETTKKDFYASKTGWKILDVVDEVLEEIERQVIEEKERAKSHRKLPGNA